MSLDQKKTPSRPKDPSVGKASNQVAIRQKPMRATAASEEQWAISSNWTGQIPVTETELAVLELYLARFIDQLIATKQRRGGNPTQARGPPT